MPHPFQMPQKYVDRMIERLGREHVQETFETDQWQLQARYPLSIPIYGNTQITERSNPRVAQDGRLRRSRGLSPRFWSGGRTNAA